MNFDHAEKPAPIMPTMAEPESSIVQVARELDRVHNELRRIHAQRRKLDEAQKELENNFRELHMRLMADLESMGVRS